MQSLFFSDVFKDIGVVLVNYFCLNLLSLGVLKKRSLHQLHFYPVFSLSLPFSYHRRISQNIPSLEILDKVKRSQCYYPKVVNPDLA